VHTLICFFEPQRYAKRQKRKGKRRHRNVTKGIPCDTNPLLYIDERNIFIVYRKKYIAI
jgi:hypothetical protein